jgi:hypothetical protein
MTTLIERQEIPMKREV